MLSGKESACNAGNSGSIPGSGICPGGGDDNPLQYSCLGNPMDKGAWQDTVHGVTKSWTQLSNQQLLKFNGVSREKNSMGKFNLPSFPRNTSYDFSTTKVPHFAYRTIREKNPDNQKKKKIYLNTSRNTPKW